MLRRWGGGGQSPPWLGKFKKKNLEIEFSGSYLQSRKYFKEAYIKIVI